MKSAIVLKAPRMPVLPPSVTPQAQRDALLPARLTAAREMLMKCEDLSELLDWKDKIAAIAAAAKAAKMTEIAKSARAIQKEALLRLGQLLSEYSADRPKGRGKTVRGMAAQRAGVNGNDVAVSVRLAKAPKEVQRRIITNDRVAASANVVRWELDKQFPNTVNRPGKIRCAQPIFNQLRTAQSALRVVSIADVHNMDAVEKASVRSRVANMLELLDAIDEAASK